MHHIRLGQWFLLLYFSTANTGHTLASSPGSNCQLLSPPKTAGETQTHGVILYLYPRSHTINNDYDGCQNQWFLDEDHYRKLSVVHYVKGKATLYDNIRINGGIGYRCHYDNQSLTIESDKRCPSTKQLKKKTYQAGCYSKSNLNRSNSYEVAFDYCRLQ